jgi:hypothetical protein
MVFRVAVLTVFIHSRETGILLGSLRVFGPELNGKRRYPVNLDDIRMGCFIEEFDAVYASGLLLKTNAPLGTNGTQLLERHSVEKILSDRYYRDTRRPLSEYEVLTQEEVLDQPFTHWLDARYRYF